MTSVRSSLLLFAFIMTGCATVTTVDGRRLSIASEGFEDYVEAVFREQNSTAIEIVFALESDELEDSDRAALVAVEESLLVACEPLNEVAARRRDGRRLGLFRGARAAREAPSCERSALEAREVLD